MENEILHGGTNFSRLPSKLKSESAGSNSWQRMQLYFLISGILIFGLLVTALASSLWIIALKNEVIDQDAMDLLQIKKIEVLIENRVSKMRAFLFTGDVSFLDEAQETQSEILKGIGLLRERMRMSGGDDSLVFHDKDLEIYEEALMNAVEMKRKNAKAKLSDYYLEEVLPKRARAKEAIAKLVENKEQQFRLSRDNSRVLTRAAFLLVSSVGLVALGLFGLMYFLFSKVALQRMKLESELKSERLKLQRSNEELEQFASVAAHDLKSPLQSMISWSEVLDETITIPRPREVDQAVSFIGTNSRKAVTLVNDLLEMARLTPSTSRPEKVDLELKVCQILSVLQNEIKDLGAKIHLSELPEVDGNPSQLELLFSNLIRNALNYSDRSRKPEITIGFKNEEDDYYEFYVKDNGIGIPQEHQHQIFRMFKRLHRYDEYPGTGIGLALCKKVVELYGGRIWVDSRVGMGSTFCFTYPKTLTNSSY